MRKTLNSEILKEMPNQEALGTFNSVVKISTYNSNDLINKYIGLSQAKLNDGDIKKANIIINKLYSGSGNKINVKNFSDAEKIFTTHLNYLYGKSNNIDVLIAKRKQSDRKGDYLKKK